MKHLAHSYSILLLLFLITACARQTSPTGGPMDTIPPKLIASDPSNQQINYKGKSIELTFNEMIELATPKEQLIITPSIGKDYKIVTKNEKVSISWDHELPDSTTYTFNFREAVKDVTERTPAENLRLAFSTGPYIDSLSIRGEIKTILEDQPIKDAIVALQPSADTFNILKHQPTYITKTDEKGIYLLENLKPGQYILYTFTDQNRNLVVDTRTERYGFLKQDITLDTATRQNLGVIRQDLRPLKMTSARPYNTYFNIKTSKNIESTKITSPENTKLTYALGSDNSNIILYNTFGSIDSIAINISLIDSIQQRFDTLLYARFTKQIVTPEKFGAALTKQKFVADKGLITGQITFTKPLNKFNFDSILYKVDSLTTLRFEPTDFRYDTLHKILQFEKRIDKKLYAKPDPNVKTQDTLKTKKLKRLNALYFGHGAFISIEQDSSNIINQTLKPLYYEDMGVLAVDVYSKRNEHTIVELLTNKKEIVATRTNQKNITFEDLPPNDYLIRLIIDVNKNGRWDAGNYLNNEEPEQIIYYENDRKERIVKLKANFEIGPLLITY